MKKINQNIEEILANHKRIAVVGLSGNPLRPSYGVARLMMREGYEVFPVNPTVDEVMGKKSYPGLLDIPGEVDLVNIFRRPEYVEEVINQAIKKGAKAVWMQLGIINEAAARKALDAGLEVVMDRCWSIEYKSRL
jgi:predicted CoA-binding protein